ncbi:Nitrite reductase (cytochrome; ammonia-forming) [Shewanella piezotolerans WP3]|uniref:Cytochrome c-552 n=1 Tax=Shewanella piezotolerans (strain WP3 / JCM 13877) TaxID=225849 RepID=B8CK22_SHEPW|nr:ammonia-forming cytochrome c nitrite reductase [Shewanella piezotolerans]ACJ27725.1 Nitrite reductase (cytochrome; ammonia-forming) [Shewanella piezotolerans WP3]
MLNKNLKITAIAMVIASISTSTLAGDEIDPRSEQYAKKFPKQYKTWKKTIEQDKKIDEVKSNPNLAVLWAGYAFSRDYDTPRGHQYAITDVRGTLRVGSPDAEHKDLQPMACWSCKGPDVPRLITEQGEDGFFNNTWSSAGAEIVNTIGCQDCHEPGSSKLRVSRPFAQRAMDKIGKEWDSASKTDRKSMVCGQCHVEYYFEKGSKKAAFPWDNGVEADNVEEFFDSIDFVDWTHQISKTPMLKAQHPDYETWSSGVHGQNNVTCIDCHMPKITNDKGRKFTDHQVGNPFDRFEQVCANCHEQSKEQMVDVVQKRQAMINGLKDRVEIQLVHAHYEAGAAIKEGASEADLKPIQDDIRHAQWRWDYATASHGIAMHNPEEALRVLGTAIDLAADARVKLARLLGKMGIKQPVAIPDISTKEKAQKAIGLNMDKLEAEKANFSKTILPKWDKEAKERESKLNK